MAVEILLPKVGAADGGTIVNWRVEDGAQVTEGDPLAAFDADGAAAEVKAPASGTLTILAKADHGHKVGALLGYIRDTGDSGGETGQ